MGQACVAGFQFGGAGGNDRFQLAQVLGQAFFGSQAAIDLFGNVAQLLIGDFYQYAYLVLFMAGRTLQFLAAGCARVALADGANNADQGLGQHKVEQHQQNQRQQQAADKSGGHGQQCAAEEVAAKGKGVDFQAQLAQCLLRGVIGKQRQLELALAAKQEVADQAIAAVLAGAVDAGQAGATVVENLGADDGGRVEQPEHQFVGQFGVDVVGDAGGGGAADFQQGMDFAVDRGVFVGVVDADLQQAQHGPQNKSRQHREAGLFI